MGYCKDPLCAIVSPDGVNEVKLYFSRPEGATPDDLRSRLAGTFGDKLLRVVPANGYSGHLRLWPSIAASRPQAGREASAVRLEGLADGLQAEIDRLRAPMTQNWTHRRAAIKQGQETRADLDERLQRALRACASALRENCLPPLLAPRLSKERLRALLGGQRFTGEAAAAQAELQSLISERAPVVVRHEAPDALADRLAQNLRGQQISGFFPTPAPLVDQVLDYLQLQDFGGLRILEPSAGIGSLALPLAAHVKEHGGYLDVVEIHPRMFQVLEARGWVPPVTAHHGDFLEWSGVYDRIAMNPPFERKQDELHVDRAISLLDDGGRLVSIMPERGALAMIRKHGGELVAVGPGAFKGPSSFRQTSVSVCLYVFDKED